MATVLPCLLGVICVVLAASRVYPADPMRAISGAVRASGVVLWPCVMFSMIPEVERSCNACLPPLVWVALAHAVDMLLLHHGKTNDGSHGSLRIDPNCIAGITFGVCGLLGQKNDSRYTHIFLYAIVICLTSVLPSHNLKRDCMEAHIFESVQKVLVTWCIGLMVTGVSLCQPPLRSMSPMERVQS